MAYISFQPSDYFNTKLYTGTGATLAVTGVGFQPDFTWIKDRDAAISHVVTDAVRGVTKSIRPDSANNEDTDTNGLTVFGADGFTVGSDGKYGTSGNDYVSWNLKAGTTSGLSGGTITPTAYSINTTSGFGIYKYTGTGVNATIAHGLGAVPTFMIIKNLASGYNWLVYHKVMGNTKYMYVDTDIAEATESTYWNNTTPTSTVFSIGTNAQVNTSSDTMVAYVFADVKGYSKFGGYTGNGNNDGAFIYTGFRPAFVMIKRLSGGDNGWVMFDNKRNTYNPVDNNLQAQWDTAENAADAGDIDILSNGFKIVVTDNDTNVSSTPYIYMAWAEFPTVSSNDIPGVAR